MKQAAASDNPSGPSDASQAPNGGLSTTSGEGQAGLGGLPSSLGGLSTCLGGLSSLSTLSGLLDSAAPFKPKVDETSRRDFGGRSNRRDDARGEESFRAGGRSGRSSWKTERSDIGGRMGRGESIRGLEPRTSALAGDGPSPSRTATPICASSPEPAAVSGHYKAEGPDPVHPVSPGSRPSSVKQTDGITDPVASGSSPPSAGTGVPVETSRWRPSGSLTPEERLRRDVNSALNKLTIENFPVVGEQLACWVESVRTLDDLAVIVELCLDKAAGEPDFSELYADLCLIMSYRCPTNVKGFVSANKFQNPFNALLLRSWKTAFERMPTKLELTPEQTQTLSLDDQEVALRKMKTRVRGLNVFLTELVVRQLAGMKRFNTAASALLAGDSPPEHFVEAVCQMLETAGAFLDGDPMGRPITDNCFGRLQELRTKGACSKRLSCLVQDLVDARRVGWHKKIHKERAKGLSAIDEEVEAASLLGGSVVTAQYGTVVKLGERSNMQGNGKYAEYVRFQEEKYASKAAS